VVNPGFHSVPAGPEHPDFGAGGTSVTEVLFLGPAALAAASKLSGIVLYRIKVFTIMKLSPMSSN